MLYVEQVTSHPWVLWGMSACRDVLSLWAFHCCCAAMCSTGDIVTPGFFEDYLNAENVLWRPYGGGEQITFNIAYNLLTLHFMKRFNQLSSERLAIALNEINIGEDMLVFRRRGVAGGGGRGEVQIECFCSMILWTWDKEAAGLNPNLGSKHLPPLLGLNVLDLVSSPSDGTQTEKQSGGGGGGGGGGMGVTLLSQLGFFTIRKIQVIFFWRQPAVTAGIYSILFTFYCCFIFYSEDSQQWQLGYTAYYLLSIVVLFYILLDLPEQCFFSGLGSVC